MEYEIACGLYVKEKAVKKKMKLRPKKSMYKFSEEITVPTIQRTFVVTQDLIEDKLNECKAICRRPQPYRIPKLYSHNKHLLRSLTSEISQRTDNITHNLERVTKAFQILTSN